MSPASILPLGYTDLPPGHLANLVTYLEMTARPPRRGSARPDLALAPLGDPARYRALFRAVGEPWLWFGRLALSDADLAAHLAHPDVAAYALTREERDIGLLELDFRGEPEAELAYFGVVPDQVGTGAGRDLMERTLDLAFARPIRRLFVHTCTHDHPGAVAFYRRSGFVPYKLAVEIHEDPRLAGLLPPEAAPHVPLIDPTSPERRPSRGTA